MDRIRSEDSEYVGMAQNGSEQFGKAQKGQNGSEWLGFIQKTQNRIYLKYVLPNIEGISIPQEP